MQSETMEPALIEWLASCSKDPYRFVLGAYPWGEPGALENFDGPNEWQAKVLKQVRDGLLTPDQAIQIAIASGHGVGKSALVSWILKWATVTKPDTRGVVTANTETQLKTKTWAELGKWYHLFIAKDHFTLTATAFFSKDPEHERTWRIDMVPWSERNTEAFAGLHNQGKRIIVLFDEASAIPDVIWETTEGALTDANTEILWIVCGNPTRNTGRFKECFSKDGLGKPWQKINVDSRSVPFTNKAQFAAWIDAYGEDSDFVRIRVKGMFPRRGEMEFFNAAEVEEAMLREVTTAVTDPVALGCDVARYGANESVICYRKGRDARTIPWEFYNGLDTVALADKVFTGSASYRCDGIFIDGGGVGGGVVDNVRHKHLHCHDVQFGGRPDYNVVTGNVGEKYANKRAEMYGAARAWIKTGALPNDPELKRQLLAITYTFNVRDEIILIRKEDMMKAGLPSPDRADALVLTFAHPMASHAYAGGLHEAKPAVETEYNPYAEDRMVA